jgi:hypothetical protein
MKKVLLFTVLLGAFGFSNAQNAPIDFEAGGFGADWTWTPFENDDNPPVEIIANPDASGGNTSATVAQFTARVTGNPWAGCETNSNADLGPFVLDATNSTIKIMVWKPVISDVGIKLASSTGWAQPEIKVANTLTNQWEELTFDFSAYVNPPGDQGQLSQIIVYPDFDLAGRTQENVVFFDNITFSAAQANPEPMTAAPTPTQDPADVISLFSDAYTNVPVDTWLTVWSAAALTDLSIEGNPTKRYANLDFAGVETVANQLDITGMTHLHVDLWSADFTFFGIKLVDFGADGAFGGGDDSEHQVNINAPAQEEWVSLDIPLTDFAGLTGQSNIAQYIIVGQPTGTTTVFLDNMFFYNGDIVVEAEPTEPAPTPIQLQANVISMFSDAYTNVSVDTWATVWSAAALADITIQGNPTKKYTNLDFVGVETVSSTINAGEMEAFHLDMWSPNATFFAVKLVDFGADGAFGGGDDTEHQINIENPAQEEWVSVDLQLSAFTGLASTEHLAQYIFVGQPTGTTTVYIDNVYFYKSPDSVEDMAGAGIPALYPNPVVAGQDVRFGDTTCAIEVYDLSGRIVRTERNAVLQTNDLSQGVYLVKLRAANGFTSTQRLTVK